MIDSRAIIEQAPLQDRDLLQRLSLYFDGFDARLKQGQGWFIFNAKQARSGRIATFIQHRLTEYRPMVSYYFVPWRDFALSSYVQEVGLASLTTKAEGVAVDKASREYELASRLTRDTYAQMDSTDLLILVGLKPAHRHEAVSLDRMIDGRYQRRLATILLTPDMPQELEAEFESLDPTRMVWERVFQRMYETSLVAL